MKPSIRKAGNPAFRTSAFAVLLLSTSALAGCATTNKPPEIGYDADAAAAAAPIRRRRCGSSSCRGRCRCPARWTPSPSRRRRRRAHRSDRARRTRPTPPRACSRSATASSTPCRSIPRRGGALYQVYAAAGQITDIALQPGEQLVGSGPVAAGDTVRWIIGDTESGSGRDQPRPHPGEADTRPTSMTNLVINTDRRTYHHRAALDASAPTWPSVVLALSAGPADRAAAPERAAPRPPVRRHRRRSRQHQFPLRASTATVRRGGRCAPTMTAARSSSSSRAASAGRDAAAVRHRPGRQRLELVNYRVRAELHDRRPPVRRRRAAPRRRRPPEDASGSSAPMGGRRHERARSPERGRRGAADRIGRRRGRPDAAARRAPRVTRLSRKVLAGIGLVASVGIGGALIYALQTRDGGRPAPRSSTRPTTGDRRWPGRTAPRLHRRSRSSARRSRAISADPSSARKIAASRCRHQPIAGLEPGGAAAAAGDRSRAHSAGSSAAREPAHGFADPGAATIAPPPAPDLAGLGLAPPPATPTAQDRQLAFLNAAVDRRTVAPDRVAAPASPYILQAGAVIPAALITGIRSDLPGPDHRAGDGEHLRQPDRPHPPGAPGHAR